MLTCNWFAQSVLFLLWSTAHAKVWATLADNAVSLEQTHTTPTASEMLSVWFKIVLMSVMTLLPLLHLYLGSIGATTGYLYIIIATLASAVVVLVLLSLFLTVYCSVLKSSRSNK